MGDVVHVHFGGRRTDSQNSQRVVSMTWNLDRSSVMVWVIDTNDRSRDEDIGSYVEHATAVQAAVGAARRFDIRVVDHTAVDALGVWNHRPVATGIHVHAAAGVYSVTVEPAASGWVATAGSYPTLDVAGDRAVELSETFALPIVDHVIGTP